ncbi:MAG: uroporphyrinogen-III synthase [Patiriisocius sp.]|jgi:uroporphyrinogen-III synthase
MVILLTRSKEQNEQLRFQILETGIAISESDIKSLPLLRTEPLSLTETAKQVVLSLDQYDDIFFISKNAAGFGLNLLERYWPQWPLSLRWLAVGAGTAEALSSALVDVTYPQTASSEGLLAMAELKEMSTRKCLIVRGVGGRETLRQGLEARGAIVNYLEVYRRLPNPIAAVELPQSKKAIVLLYSGEAIAHFKSLCGNELDEYRLIVPSSRLQIMANDLGFAKVELANSQEDHAMLKVLQQTQRQVL